MAALSRKRFLATAAVFAIACFSVSDGEVIPLDRIYFPVGLALSEKGDRLYVANSNSDLQFNTGSVLALDTREIRQWLPKDCRVDSDCLSEWHCKLGAGISGRCVDSAESSCGELGRATPGEQSLAPGPCGPLETSRAGLVVGAARTAPFSTDLSYATYQDADGKRYPRIFLAVRGDATLTWADVREGDGKSGLELDCGQASHPQLECDSRHRQGNDAEEASPQGEQLPTEPTWLAQSQNSGLIAMGHRTVGKASLFENTADGPRLSYVLSGLGTNPQALAAVPPSRYAEVQGLDTAPGFLVTYTVSGQQSPRIDLLRYVAPSAGLPYLQGVTQSTFQTLQLGTDTRGIAVDNSQRLACEQRCEPDAKCSKTDEACVLCLRECALVPLDVYAANRTPAALLIGKTRTALTSTGSDDVPDFSDAAPLRGQPERVVAGSVLGLDGRPEPRVFVLSYDTRHVYIYDPHSGVIESETATGSGPQAFVVDAERGLGYVAHQSYSYIGVVDLDRRHSSYGQMVLNIGRPTPPHSSK
jgi:DNA-binding beta-propeller fold protein YncE